MDAITTMNRLYYLLVLATKVKIIAGDCKIGSKVTSIRYSETILNHTLVGPVLSSITTINERECEKECHLAVPNICNMFNYYPSSKVCELLYKDRVAEYKVKKKEGYTFKTRKCDSNRCKYDGQCYSLGDKTSNLCICLPLFQGIYCESCKPPISSTIKYIEPITNYTIVGPIFKSFKTVGPAVCECACQWYDQGLCYMFNYYPWSKLCELFYKDRAAEYKVEEKEGSTFKAPKCKAGDPCLNGGTCFSLGLQNTTDRKMCMCRDMFKGPFCQHHTCDFGPNVTPYTEAFVNYTIVGPLLWSFVATNESACECACLKNEDDLCFMFSYNPSTRLCQLHFKNRAAEYKVVKMVGSLFKTNKCYSNPCLNYGQCYSLGDNTSNLCFCLPILHGAVCESCKETFSNAIQYIDVMTNYTIVGPVLESFTTSSQDICQCFCQWHGQGLCYMFNYYPSSKVCELFYKDRPTEYKVVKKEGSTLKAPKCEVDPCLNDGKCIALGHQHMTKFCLCRVMFNGPLCQHHTCDLGPNVTPFTEAIVNYTIVGPVLWSFVATNESACECACLKNEDDLCFMFSYNPSTRLCQLHFENRAAEYKVVKMVGSMFKTRKCLSNPCLNEGKCYVLGDQNLKSCHCHPMFTGSLCATPICKIDPSVSSIQYSPAMSNYVISGPVLRSLTTINEMACECTCQLTAKDLCYMFNFNPSTKLCQLFYKDRAAEYSVTSQAGSKFKTRKCESNPCYTGGGQCYSLSDQKSKACLCNATHSGKYCHVALKGIKVNTAAVCIGARDDKYGTFVSPFNGKVKTFRLVHLYGGVTHIGGDDTSSQGNWGAKYSSVLIVIAFPSKIELHVTYDNKVRITPPVGYPLDMTYDRMGYDLPGFTNMSPELVFPEISPQITVTKGQKFRIWYGQDYTDNTEFDNTGTTCADVYIYYTE